MVEEGEDIDTIDDSELSFDRVDDCELCFDEDGDGEGLGLEQGSFGGGFNRVDCDWK